MGGLLNSILVTVRWLCLGKVQVAYLVCVLYVTGRFFVFLWHGSQRCTEWVLVLDWETGNVEIGDSRRRGGSETVEGQALHTVS